MPSFTLIGIPDSLDFCNFMASSLTPPGHNSAPRDISCACFINSSFKTNLSSICISSVVIFYRYLIVSKTHFILSTEFDYCLGFALRSFLSLTLLRCRQLRTRFPDSFHSVRPQIRLNLCKKTSSFLLTSSAQATSAWGHPSQK